MLNEEGKRALEKPVFFPQTSFRQTGENSQHHLAQQAQRKFTKHRNSDTLYKTYHMPENKLGDQW